MRDGWWDWCAGAGRGRGMSSGRWLWRWACFGGRDDAISRNQSQSVAISRNQSSISRASVEYQLHSARTSLHLLLCSTPALSTSRRLQSRSLSRNLIPRLCVCGRLCGCFGSCVSLLWEGWGGLDGMGCDVCVYTAFITNARTGCDTDTPSPRCPKVGTSACTRNMHARAPGGLLEILTKFAPPTDCAITEPCALSRVS